ncbi:hypothetical protein B0J18DRAFT_854 [Chaetomium sp. MPI-SDFR-AT-0129]|nr:hypothetical protein B0J18DRAFT_854 [Chaetomium sp. MPI-SDFR-AT-0129]
MNNFQPRCTLPDSTPVFVKGPDVRSTLDIVWSSVAIILLCTWSILHLNVPPQVRPLPPPKSTWETCRRAFWEAWYPFSRKVKWMLLTLIVPENIFGVALAEFWTSWQCTKQIQGFQEHEEKLADEIEWTRTHTLYANMGGFVLKFPPKLVESAIRDPREWTGDHFLWQMIHEGRAGHSHLGPFDWDAHLTHYELARTWIEYNDPDGARPEYVPPLPPLSEESQRQQAQVKRGHGISGGPAIRRHAARAFQGDAWTLTAAQMLVARRVGIIDRFPDIMAADIDDKNKGDSVAKILALSQVVWLVVQLIARAKVSADAAANPPDSSDPRPHDRAVSPLEITALAYAVCSFFTYLLLWGRPQDVRRPTVFHAVRSPTYEEFEALLRVAPRIHGMINEEHQFRSYALPTSTVSSYEGQRGRPGGKTATWWSDGDLVMPGLMGGLTVFGGLHLIAWEFAFQGEKTQTLWRVLSLVITAFPPVVLVAYKSLNWLTFKLESTKSGLGEACMGVTAMLLWLVIGIFVCFFPLIRLGLLVEAFWSTYYLPPSAYLSTWANEMPYVG